MYTNWTILQRLMKSFPNSFINGEGEFIASVKGNQYFILEDCESDTDVKCKVLEWLSRGAFKTEPYKAKKYNDEFHKFMLCGINKFLETNFSTDDIEIIYQKLGNRVNHKMTVDFVLSGYDMKLIKERLSEREQLIRTGESDNELSI